MNVHTRAREIAGAILRVDPQTLGHESSPDTIPAWDSLRHIQLVLALEEAFNIQFAVEDIEAMGTIGAVVDAVRRHAQPE